MSIKKIDIILLSHTDLGYTDHPVIALELQKQYIDEALKAIEDTNDGKAGERFCWTCESLYIAYEWWKDADENNRKRFINAIDNGRIEVSAYPFNNTSVMNDDEWDMMFGWVPDELWRKFRIRTGIQNDVGAVPVASVMKLAKKGINHLFSGLNGYNGDMQFDIPSAFNWKLPDGESVFVWLNTGYWNAFDLFNKEWWRLPGPGADDLNYRSPVKGDFFKDDDESVLKAHAWCLEVLKDIEGKNPSGKDISGFNNKYHWGAGYDQDRMIAAMANQWRTDNDPPFTPIVDFVRKWNSLGLQPELRITIPSEALDLLESEIKDKIPEYSGEWTDWWVHGVASNPVALSASRKAKRLIKELKSDFFSPLSQKSRTVIEEALRSLCIFDEHTWGFWGSVFFPYSTSTIMQEVEKSAKAYRPLVTVKYLEAEHIRAKLQNEADGIYLTNVTKIPKSQWIELPANCLRGEYTHVRNTESGIEEKLVFRPGMEVLMRPASTDDFSRENISRALGDAFPDKRVAFWSGTVTPESTVRFELIRHDDSYGDMHENPADRSAMDISLDKFGWPESIIWKGMTEPLFTKGLADFITCKPSGFTPRNVLKDMFFIDDPKDSIAAYKEYIVETKSWCEKMAEIEDTENTVIIKQEFRHQAIEWGIRRIEIWKDQPRARVNVKINRKSSMDPEIFYIDFPLPCKGVIPTVSNGGYCFTPGKGQLPGSYMDYLAIDGWAHYKSADGQWLWNSEDSPLISFEKPQVGLRNKTLPEGTHRILSIVFDNTWDTNFVADTHGVFEYNYDLIWLDNSETIQPDKLVQDLAVELKATVKVR